MMCVGGKTTWFFLMMLLLHFCRLLFDADVIFTDYFRLSHLFRAEYLMLNDPIVLADFLLFLCNFYCEDSLSATH